MLTSAHEGSSENLYLFTGENKQEHQCSLSYVVLNGQQVEYCLPSRTKEDKTGNGLVWIVEACP